MSKYEKCVGSFLAMVENNTTLYSVELKLKVFFKTIESLMDYEEIVLLIQMILKEFKGSESIRNYLELKLDIYRTFINVNVMI